MPAALLAFEYRPNINRRGRGIPDDLVFRDLLDIHEGRILEISAHSSASWRLRAQGSRSGRTSENPMISTLLLIYIFCMVLGGIFVGLSVFGGLFEGDADLDAAGDIEIDAEVDADFEVSIGRRFNPFVSFKFYTFGLAFFGLTGVLFTALNLMQSSVGIFALSLGMGLFTGLAMAYVLFRLNASGGSEGITSRDYAGLPAKIMLPVSAERNGKVRLSIRGRIIEMPARAADDEVVFDFGEDRYVLGIEDGVVQVVRPSALLGASEAELGGD